MEDNNRVINKIETFLDKKLDELISLQGEKEELRQNMADPDTINENAFDVEEKQRELNVLQEVKEYAAESGDTSVDNVFAIMLENYDDMVKHHEEQGSDTTEAKLNYNSLKIVSEEIESISDGDNGNDDANDSDGSAPMDTSSSDE